MKFKFSKLVIAITCFTSTIDFDHSAYDLARKDIDNNLPSILLSGIRWSANKSFACVDASECNNSQMDRYEFVYTPPSNDFGSGFGSDFGNDYGNDYGNDGGGGGGGSSSSSGANSGTGISSDDKETVSDALTLALNLKAEINKLLLSKGLDNLDRRNLNKLVRAMDKYVSKLNKVTAIINSGAQVLNHANKNELKEAIAEVAGAIVGIGVGAATGAAAGGPAGAVVGFVAGMYSEKGAEYLLKGGAQAIALSISRELSRVSPPGTYMDMICAYSFRNEVCRNRHEP